VDSPSPIISERLDGRTALVTGGSRGIGKAICLALAARGASVAVHYREQAQAAETVVEQIQSAGGKAIALQADMADAQAIARLVNEAAAQLGAVDILVNNAGEMTDSSVADMPDEMWEQTIAVNLTAVFRCARACIPSMKQRRWGRIINLSSQAAYTGSANHAHYAAAKSGLLGFSFSLAKELGAFGITVNVVSPGRITTDMLMVRASGREQEWMQQTPLRRLGEPEEVASAVAFLASDAARYITGANLHVNGGLTMG
jgi:3-oxoacyl-[acyl-carrier protein] reductase